MKRVAVVGAGPSGLVTVKELLAEGHEPTCFEKADGIGGVFRFHETDGAVWESCHLTSSGTITAFSDFPVSPSQTGHMRVGEYVDYLAAYCEEFRLNPHLRFSTTVESIVRGPEAGWIVRTRDAHGTRDEHFDSVAICSGLNQRPVVPRFPGQETFPGEIIHGSRYRRPAQIKGKRVLVVGGGESGADIIAESAAHAAESVLSLRRGVGVLPRSSFGKPNDFQTSRLHNSPAHWIYQTRNPSDDPKRKTYRRIFLPFLFIDKGLQLFVRLFWRLPPLFRTPNLHAIRTNFRARTLRRELLSMSGGTVNEQFGTKSDDFLRCLAEGRCRLAPELERIEASRVIFQDGSTYTPDVIIFCTGFETHVPILDNALTSAPRFLGTFNPAAGFSLGFIGFLRPAFGALPPLAELQARWFALVQSGRLPVPSETEMTQSIERWRNSRAHIFRAVRGRLEHLVDFTPFCDELAARIGCKPTWRDLRRESRKLRSRFFAAPFVGAQYRLVGPHAKPELARATIENLEVTHPWPEILNLHLRWTLSRILHRIKGSEYAPRLELNP